MTTQLLLNDYCMTPVKSAPSLVEIFSYLKFHPGTVVPPYGTGRAGVAFHGVNFFNLSLSLSLSLLYSLLKKIILQLFDLSLRFV